MKIPTFPNRPPDQLLSAKFHLMVGPNLFTDTTVTLNITQQVLRVSGKWGVNKEIKLNMRDLAEIRVGLHTDKWIELSARAEPLCSLKRVPENVHHFSLVSKSSPAILPGQTVELITKNAKEFKEWIAELKELVSACQVKESKIRTDQIIMLEHFYEKKIKSSLMMANFKLKKFIEKININIGKEHLDEIFKLYGLSSYGNVTQEQFIQLMTHFDSRSGLDFIFYKYSIAHSEFMSAEGLRRFFEAEQREHKSLPDCVQLISAYSSSLFDTTAHLLQQQQYTGTGNSSNNYLSRRAFYRLVDIEQSFALFSPGHHSVCQDMGQPMSHYFIASSHNSYLVGNQLTSASSYEMYRRILLDGCRCIELDVWDGSSEPEVYHGHTFTSRILLRGILEVIAEAAFVTSDYPVILSIENHLSPPFQKQMAQMMREILRQYIYLDEVPEKQTQFPSPEVFKKRIFIKGSKSETFVMPDSESTTYSFLCMEWTRANAPKKKKQHLTSQHSFIRHDFDSDDDDIEDEEGEEAEADQNVNNTNEASSSRVQASNQMTQRRRRRRRLNLNTLRNMAIYRGRSYSLRQVWTTQSPPSQPSLEGISENVDEKKERLLEDHLSSADFERSQSDGQALTKAIVTDFSSVINYFKTKKFSNIADAIKEFKFYEMCSRDENASKRIFTNSPKEYRQFTSTNMVRIYPHGLRTNSANYMPLDHWDVGAQMVALNYQTISVAMLINWAQFALNGRSGYVLKPAFLRLPGQVKLPKDLPKTMLQVTILCGQFWKPFEGKVELKVSTRVYCPDKEQRMDLKKPESTKVVADNGFNPVWNETFTFDLSNPELSFVQFTLVNAKDFVGHHMISFQAMQRGVRHINLFDHDNKPIPFARIYVKIDHWLQGKRKT